MIGLKHKQNFLAAYDPEWPYFFNEERNRLQSVLWSISRNIEHHGSTAIPQLPAKPIIDILVGILPLDKWIECKKPLESPGYEYAEHAGVPGHYIFGRGKIKAKERTWFISSNLKARPGDSTLHFVMRSEQAKT